MIVVCDVNEIWRKKPFAALAEEADVLGVSPADWRVARRRGFPSSEGALDVLPVTLPPSWASRMAGVGQRLLWRKIQNHCKKLGKPIEALFVTSPHYLPLLGMVPPDLKTFYYASDDYRSYEGWGHVADLEKEMVHRVDHSFFVSEALMERARKEYGVASAKLSVSMNATEKRFFLPEKRGPTSPPEGTLKRPIAGVVGGINDRLDFNVLLQCARLPELGTLLLVGPTPETPSAELQTLLAHPKCVSVGRQPHDTIHQWFQCLDVGLIPYTPTEFNRLCSPMRLFDHLASGAPVVATDACEQSKAFSNQVSVCTGIDEFLREVRAGFSRSTELIDNIIWKDRAKCLEEVIRGVSHG